jgi:hypothetical protein
VWASIWSKAIPHDGNLLATVMDHQHCYCNNLAPRLHLLSTNLQATRRRRRRRRNISFWFIPVVYYFPFSFSIQKYLQTQLKNPIVGWLSALTFVLHVLLSWIFVSKMSLGIPGAMGAMIISYWLVLIGMFMYVFGGWCPNTWCGFSVAAFHDLLPVLKLSISSGVMLW